MVWDAHFEASRAICIFPAKGKIEYLFKTRAFQISLINFNRHDGPQCDLIVRLKNDIAIDYEHLARQRDGAEVFLTGKLFAFFKRTDWVVSTRNIPRSPRVAPLRFACPELWQLLWKPFLHAQREPKEKIQRVLDHYRIIQKIGHPFDLPINHFVKLIILNEIISCYTLKLDNPKWVLQDGLLTLSICNNSDRLFSIHFVFGYSGNDIVAYIGGVQGRRGEGVRDQYRAFMRDAQDLYPSHVLLELFRAVCAAVGATCILAVSNVSRHQQSLYFTRRQGYIDPVVLDYDALWLERGGVPLGDFYALPLIAPDRDLATIPRKKRVRHTTRRQLHALF